MSALSGDDLVYYKENGRVMSGGFDINSILMKQGISPFSSLNSNELPVNQSGGSSVSNLFKSLAVPSGLLYLHEKKKSHKQLNYFQSGGKKNPTESLIKEPEEEEEDEDEESDDEESDSDSDSDDESTTSSSESSSNSSSDNEEEIESNKYVEDSEVLSEDVFKKCLDIVTKMEIAKQKAQKRKTRKNADKKEKPEKKKQTKKRQSK